MTLASLIGFGINASMFLIVLAVGLHATLGDALSLFRQPGLLARSILSMNVLMLALVVLVDWLFDLAPAIEIALVCLAVSPVPPVLPGKQMKAGGPRAYVVGLLAAASIVAIVLVPLAIELLGRSFGLDIHVPPWRIAGIVAVSILLPLVIGLVVRRLAPGFAEKAARPLSLFASGLLLVCFLPILFESFPAFWAMIGNGVILVLAAFTVVGLVVGHLLGGPDPDNRTVLALATATRHPAVAMAVAAINFPDEKAVGVVVIYHLVLGGIFAAPYVTRRTRLHTAMRKGDATE